MLLFSATRSGLEANAARAGDQCCEFVMRGANPVGQSKSTSRILPLSLGGERSPQHSLQQAGSSSFKCYHLRVLLADLCPGWAMLSKVVTGAEGLERACSASLKQALCNLLAYSSLILGQSWSGAARSTVRNSPSRKKEKRQHNSISTHYRPYFLPNLGPILT